VDFVVQEEDGSFVMVEVKGLIKNSRWELVDDFKDLRPELCQLFLYSYLTGMKDCVLVWGEQEEKEEEKKIKIFARRFA
jgi:hypothetical protein